MGKKGKVHIGHFIILLYRYLQRPYNVKITERAHPNHTIHWEERDWGSNEKGESTKFLSSTVGNQSIVPKTEKSRISYKLHI